MKPLWSEKKDKDCDVYRIWGCGREDEWEGLETNRER